LNFNETKLPGIILIAPQRFGDDRGWFSESWSQRALAQAGIDLDFVQDNHSFSTKIGTVRGLHYQSPPHAQGKLVRASRGRILDVAVDIRMGSPTFGQWIAEELSAQNGKQLLVPVGFLHGFATLETDTEVQYKCTDYYAPDCDGAVRFDDPDIAIDWGLGSTAAVLSDKDAAAPAFKGFKSPFVFKGQVR
jgi:dTDP-4-dehydrorhamnose 3,5-epimerase